MAEFSIGVVSLFGVGILWALAAVLTALGITGIIYDAMKARWLWLVVDIAVPPVGIVRGMLIWFASEKIRKGVGAASGGAGGRSV